MNCCDALGIPNAKISLDQMIVMDYLIANEDRHQNNFGAIRNAKTLEWIGCAPIYDSGTALWFDKPTPMVGTMKISCKPFKSSHDEQIKLVSNFDWLNLNALTGIEEELQKLVKDSLFIDESRCAALCEALRNRVNRLTKIVNSHVSTYPVDNKVMDVARDVAYSGEDTK